VAIIKFIIHIINIAITQIDMRLLLHAHKPQMLTPKNAFL